MQLVFLLHICDWWLLLINRTNFLYTFFPSLLFFPWSSFKAFQNKVIRIACKPTMIRLVPFFIPLPQPQKCWLSVPLESPKVVLMFICLFSSYVSQYQKVFFYWILKSNINHPAVRRKASAAINRLHWLQQSDG